ncbi:hypothetical protein Tco_0544446, partial [Tanacetum coccineum]
LGDQVRCLRRLSGIAQNPSLAWEMIPWSHWVSFWT